MTADANHDPAGRITLQPQKQRLRIWAGNVLIADSRAAIELRETGYPPRQYLPRADVALDYLVASETVTHCPFKGDASYYSLRLDDHQIADAVWSYEQPFAAMSAIAGRLAFDNRRVREQFGD